MIKTGTHILFFYFMKTLFNKIAGFIRKQWFLIVMVLIIIVIFFLFEL